VYKLVLFFLIFSTLSYAQDLEDLLTDLKQATDLSEKTRNEAIGNLVVYTRDDIERMQANTLKDLLKSVRNVNYQESRIGQPDSFNTDPLIYGSSVIRIYLNEHELVSPLVGSGFILFGNMELDFIDHVEIYQGLPSLKNSSEPAAYVIRLYTRTAEHDAGGRVKAQVGTYGSNSFSTYYTQELEDYSYFAYVSRRDDKNEDIDHNGKALSKDKMTQRLYVSLSSDDNVIELHASKSKAKALMGSSFSITSALADPNTSDTPEDTNLDNDKYFSLSWLSYFQDKSLTLSVSAMSSKTTYNATYSPALDYRPLGPITEINSVDQIIKEDSYTIGLLKEFKLGKNHISTGMKFRHKKFNMTDIDVLGYNYPNTTPIVISGYDQPYDSTDISSVFIEDEYQLSDTQIISVSLMYQLPQ
jgi:iron complex outermembrane receptor protein